MFVVNFDFQTLTPTLKIPLDCRLKYMSGVVIRVFRRPGPLLGHHTRNMDYKLINK